MENKDKKSTSVNEQITDAVTQSNVKAVGEAPAIALGNVYQTAAHSTGIMFENAVNNQNQQNILGQAATTQGVMQIYSLDTVADAVSIAQMMNPNGRNAESSSKNNDKKE
ncbi:Killing trait domain-containing protein [Chryseobacterium arachidis]|uniref:Killing trait domain-containing protein n=1 Tax=Chryseobacterium arachidis TaxID=1416778 RepID=A0A1M4SWT2_9FLAO|nr:RebB family R body protein [Chryseobacterium arachidis]SHE36655.1 Killing trait domain-containing protein [Chryseobacterium arachidis]